MQIFNVIINVRNAIRMKSERRTRKLKCVYKINLRKTLDMCVFTLITVLIFKKKITIIRKWSPFKKNSGG